MQHPHLDSHFDEHERGLSCTDASDQDLYKAARRQGFTRIQVGLFLGWPASKVERIRKQIDGSANAAARPGICTLNSTAPPGASDREH